MPIWPSRSILPNCSGSSPTNNATGQLRSPLDAAGRRGSGLRVGQTGASMKLLMLAGVVLIVLGAVALWYRQSYTEREAGVDIGSFHASVNREKTFSFPPAVGIIAIAGGAALAVLGMMKRS